ncbi:hypothetical protein GOP47_0026378 [Adiantum capillus-veneris]|nr:hypothetical protein GOP47_0026378 [Adiantum capillus-veneris]
MLLPLCNFLAIAYLIVCVYKLLQATFSKPTPADARGGERSTATQPDVEVPRGSERAQYYHVFLSHRGPDTKHTLGNVLHMALASKGISCFIDYAMSDGEQAWGAIVHAIRNSAVQIVVLSPEFGSSKWCLDEVHEIMQLPSSPASVHVLPIFYKVEPSHLRYPKPGSRFDVTTLKRTSLADHRRWSSALKEISLIKGFLFEEKRASKTFEGQMVFGVVARVLELLKNSVPLYVEPSWVDHYSTALDHAKKFLDIQNNSDGKKVVSIGVTGLNKSIFARLLFNKLHSRFFASCILLNVREQANSAHGGLVNLQSKLLRDLAKVDKAIQHPDEGLALLLEHLQNIKCFIVLDDIDMDMKQLKNLLILNKHQLGSGSRLVLTSRHRPVLQYNWANVDNILPLGIDSESASDKTSLAICYETKDVHTGFINHLKESFSMLGLSVSEIKGAHLLRAFQQGPKNTYIIILSRTFLDSATLLNEMDELSGYPDAKLVYIFYGMGKSAKDSFLESIRFGAHAFSSNSSPPTIGKQLLRSLSQKAVYYFVNLEEPKKSFSDVAFKALITDIVSNHLRHSHKVSVTSFPVGLMERQQELESLLRSPSGETVSIGIVGMGGLGKTTLVKSLYNNIHKNFEGSVLILNVRAEANQHGLRFLQQALFDNVLGSDQVANFMSVDAGKALLSRRLLGTNTLVILDDVDDRSQLDALYTDLKLGSGSRVIITSRNREVLEAAKVNNIYEMQFLGPESAKMLFCWHAFLQPYPPIGLVEIAQQVIDSCQGLPLSLQGKDIFDTLRISVDALERDLQEAFLDVSCFLIGKPAETALRVWKGCGWTALHYLEVLKNKSLITVDSQDGLIGMHDQIRDMGRYIAAERSPKTHIWDMEDMQALSHGDVGQLRGFAWISQEAKSCNADALSGRLSQLKLLLLRNVELRGNLLNRRHNEIRWLQWHNSTFNVLPRELCSRTLRVLDLSGSALLQALWRSYEMCELPEELLELNLSGCKALVELPHFDPFLRHLEWLSLHDCEGLNYLDSTINSMTQLKFLDLGGCRRLRSLPAEMQGLCCVEKLLLAGCELLEKLPEIGQLQNLIEISLDSTGLTTLPSSFGQLKNLEKLSLSNCSNFASLPYSIGGLEMLRVCNLNCCSKLLELPDSFCELVNLEHLNLGGCNLVDLPERIGNLEKLTTLQLEGNGRLRRLPRSVGNLLSLKSLKLGRCSLEEDGMPRELEGLESLGELELQHNNNFLRTPPCFAHLGGLSTLFMYYCGNLKEVAFLPCTLRYVSMAHCPQLKRVDSLVRLTRLETLVLCDCGLQTVKRLHLAGSGVAPSTHLLEMSTLEHITWYGSGMPEDFPDDCMSNTIHRVEHANELVMTIEIPISMSRQSRFTILLWLVSHDQGWSDYRDDHGSYEQSPTFIEAFLVRGGTRVAGDLLYRNRHAEREDQVHLVILRPECGLLTGAEAHDRLEIRARSLYQAWRITVMQASYMVVVGGPEQLQACLRNISVRVEDVIRRSQAAVHHSPQRLIPLQWSFPLQNFQDVIGRVQQRHPLPAEVLREIFIRQVQHSQEGIAEEVFVRRRRLQQNPQEEMDDSGVVNISSIPSLRTYHLASSTEGNKSTNNVQERERSVGSSSVA